MKKVRRKHSLLFFFFPQSIVHFQDQMYIQLILHEGFRRRKKLLLVFILSVQERCPMIQDLLSVTSMEKSYWSNQQKFT